MAHLLSQEAQEQIEEAAEPTAEEEALEEEVALEVVSPPSEPPETSEAMAYRLGQLESRLESLATQLAASMRVVAQQEQEIAATEAQLEIQEEALASAVEDDQEECKGENPPLWCRLLAGHKRKD